MTTTFSRPGYIRFDDLRLYRLTAANEQLEAGCEEGFGPLARVSTVDMHRILDRIADELKRLEGELSVSADDTTPELSLEAAETPRTRLYSPTALMQRLVGVVETLRTLETSAYAAGDYPLGEGLSTLAQRFDDTLGMMVVNIRDAILADADPLSNSGLPSGPNT
jgi:hypothetical protein